MDIFNEKKPPLRVDLLTNFESNKIIRDIENFVGVPIHETNAYRSWTVKREAGATIVPDRVIATDAFVEPSARSKEAEKAGAILTPLAADFREVLSEVTTDEQASLSGSIIVHRDLDLSRHLQPPSDDQLAEAVLASQDAHLFEPADGAISQEPDNSPIETDTSRLAAKKMLIAWLSLSTRQQQAFLAVYTGPKPSAAPKQEPNAHLIAREKLLQAVATVSPSISFAQIQAAFAARAEISTHGRLFRNRAIAIMAGAMKLKDGETVSMNRASDEADKVQDPSSEEVRRPSVRSQTPPRPLLYNTVVMKLQAAWRSLPTEQQNAYLAHFVGNGAGLLSPKHPYAHIAAQQALISSVSETGIVITSEQIARAFAVRARITNRALNRARVLEEMVQALTTSESVACAAGEVASASPIFERGASGVTDQKSQPTQLTASGKIDFNQSNRLLGAYLHLLPEERRILRPYIETPLTDEVGAPIPIELPRTWPVLLTSARSHISRALKIPSGMIRFEYVLEALRVLCNDPAFEHYAEKADFPKEDDSKIGEKFGLSKQDVKAQRHNLSRRVASLLSRAVPG